MHKYVCGDSFPGRDNSILVRVEINLTFEALFVKSIHEIFWFNSEIGHWTRVCRLSRHNCRGRTVTRDPFMFSEPSCVPSREGRRF